MVIPCDMTTGSMTRWRIPQSSGAHKIRVPHGSTTPIAGLIDPWHVTSSCVDNFSGEAIGEPGA